MTRKASGEMPFMVRSSGGFPADASAPAVRFTFMGNVGRAAGSMGNHTEAHGYRAIRCWNNQAMEDLGGLRDHAWMWVSKVDGAETPSPNSG
jgi:hypothetical protein